MAKPFLTFKWKCDALAEGLGINKIQVKNYIADGRRCGFAIERRAAKKLRGKVAESEGEKWDLKDANGKKWEVRCITDAVSFASSSNVGIGRPFNEDNFLTKLSTVYGFILADVSEEELPKVRCWKVTSRIVRRWWEAGKLSPKASLARSKILNLLHSLKWRFTRWFIAILPGYCMDSLHRELLDFREFGKKTESFSKVFDEHEISYFVNEFWTSKQRAAHSIHEISYRACFKPQLPRFFIERLTEPGDRVYDPFLGRGTTLLEAALLDRVPVGCDINPLSQLLCEPRLSPPSIEDVANRLLKIPTKPRDPVREDLLGFYHPGNPQ